MAWSPLGGGALFVPANPALGRLRQRLVDIGVENGVEPDAVAIAWVLAHPAKIMPVAGTNNPERIARLSDSFKVRIDRETWFEFGRLPMARKFLEEKIS
jgi:predicted oxidoreductase